MSPWVVVMKFCKPSSVIVNVPGTSLTQSSYSCQVVCGLLYPGRNAWVGLPVWGLIRVRPLSADTNSPADSCRQLHGATIAAFNARIGCSIYVAYSVSNSVQRPGGGPTLVVAMVYHVPKQLMASSVTLTACVASVALTLANRAGWCAMALVAAGFVVMVVAAMGIACDT